MGNQQLVLGESPPPPSVGILGREHNLAVDANYSLQICFFEILITVVTKL
jgi:hypothetical protein